MNNKPFLDNLKIDSIFGKENILRKINSGRILTVKSGIDPTATDLHLGHLVGLTLLRDFLKWGHKVVFVIGDFTAQLGDGKVRPKLSLDETKSNTKFCVELINKILGTENVQIVRQSEWMEKMSLEEFLREMSLVSVQKLLTHETFKTKIDDKEPLWENELVYPLLMAIDSVVLKPDVEVGSLEQKFNFQLTRTVMRKHGLESEDFILNKRLPGIDGSEKMSKSQNNQIGLNENIDSQVEKLMTMPMDLLQTFWELLAESSIKPLDREEMVVEILVTLHPKDEIMNAIKKVGVVELPVSGKQLIDVLKQSDETKSAREWKRLVGQRGIRINDVVVDFQNIRQVVKTGDGISVGKNKRIKIIDL